MSLPAQLTRLEHELKEARADLAKALADNAELRLAIDGQAKAAAACRLRKDQEIATLKTEVATLKGELAKSDTVVLPGEEILTPTDQIPRRFSERT